MADLRSSVRNAIASFVQRQGDTNTPTDVLRVIRDQAALMYEHQVLCDALDSDPMQQLSNIRQQIERVKPLLNVTTCSRVATVDGYSSIDAVVELRRDEHMNAVVDSNVQLTFHFERRPSRPEDNNGSPRSDALPRGTHICYWIELSRDYGGKERLLTVEVWAAGEGPSAEPARMWDIDSSMEESNRGLFQGESPDKSESSTSQERSASASESQGSGEAEPKAKGSCDRFAAHVDMDAISKFLSWTQLEGLDGGICIFFLMTFPFYEHEWDLVGFITEAMFGDLSEEEDPGKIMSDEEEDEEEGNRMVSDEEE